MHRCAGAVTEAGAPPGLRPPCRWSASVAEGWGCSLSSLPLQQGAVTVPPAPTPGAACGGHTTLSRCLSPLGKSMYLPCSFPIGSGAPGPCYSQPICTSREVPTQPRPTLGTPPTRPSRQLFPSLRLPPKPQSQPTLSMKALNLAPYTLDIPNYSIPLQFT